MQFSIVSQKGQITIPAKLRKALNLRAGDKVIFDINSDNVVTFHESMLLQSEWNSAEDNEAYADL